MKTFKALIKATFFGILILIVGKILYDHGSVTVAGILRESDIDWPRLLKDIGLIALLIMFVTGMQRSWANRFYGTTKAKKVQRKRNRKIDDVIRIPK